LSLDWVGLFLVAGGIALLFDVARRITRSRGPVISVATLLVCLSAGVMLWMMVDVVTDASYESVPSTSEDWVLWGLLTLPCAGAVCILPFSVWKSDYRLFLIAAALSSISILFPFGIIAGVLIWWGCRDESRYQRSRISDRMMTSSIPGTGRVDLPRIAKMMESRGFRNVRLSAEYEGVQFQIVADARIGLQKMTTVIRVVDELDGVSAERIADEFLRLHKVKSSYIFGTFFLYCLITERRYVRSSSWLLDAIHKGTHGSKDTYGAGGGHMIVADVASGGLWIKETKEGVTRFERRMIDILMDASLVRPMSDSSE